MKFNRKPVLFVRGTKLRISLLPLLPLIHLPPLFLHANLHLWLMFLVETIGTMQCMFRHQRRLVICVLSPRVQNILVRHLGFGTIGKSCTLTCLFQSFMPQERAYELMQVTQLQNSETSLPTACKLLNRHQHQYNRHYHLSLKLQWPLAEHGERCLQIHFVMHKK